MSEMSPRDGKKARNSLKQFAEMMKGLTQLDEHLADYDSLDTAILDKQKSLAELTKQEVGLEAKIAKVDAACNATIAEAEARKSGIEGKIADAQGKLESIESQIATAKSDLEAAITNRASDIASTTAEAEKRLSILNGEINAAEDKLASTRATLKALREHLAGSAA